MKKNSAILILSSLVIMFSLQSFSETVKNTLKNNQKTTKNANSFWDNDEESALKEATLKKKPILIDFYGIWCPPCNMLDESVFSTKEFKKAAEKFVLLKMDADSEKSWILKSKYKVGGYPTIIIAKVEDNIAGNEIDRIVGYEPTESIVKKMNESLMPNSVTKNEQLNTLLKKMITDAEVADDSEAALKYTNAGLLINPEDISLKISKLSYESQKDKDLADKKESKKILIEAFDKRKNLTLSDLIAAYNIKPKKEILDEMLSRVNPATLFVDNESYSEGDIYGMGADLGEAEKNEALQKVYYGMAADSYKKTLTKYGENSRGLNLTYVYYLAKSGKTEEAENIINKMISLYPDEFTFYYQAAQLQLENKKFGTAKDMIKKSIEKSYGDNKLRSFERALEIGITTFKSTKADLDRNDLQTTITTSEKFLGEFKQPKELKVRTDRYIKKLATQIETAKKL